MYLGIKVKRFNDVPAGIIPDGRLCYLLLTATPFRRRVALPLEISVTAGFVGSNGCHDPVPLGVRKEDGTNR